MTIVALVVLHVVFGLRKSSIVLYMYDIDRYALVTIVGL
jgi:hypothetical protein